MPRAFSHRPAADHAASAACSRQATVCAALHSPVSARSSALGGSATRSRYSPHSDSASGRPDSSSGGCAPPAAGAGGTFCVTLCGTFCDMPAGATELA
eukprot:344118-Chlamydomonas_euryale.AAC.1